MAGVGFQLRKMLARDSYSGQAAAYGYAGLLSSGPWLLSIAGVLAIAWIAGRDVSRAEQVTQLLVCVTYLMAGSVLLTGPLQLMFSRFVADRIYERKAERILPNLLGALALTTVASGLFAWAVALLAFREPLARRALLVASFVVLSDGWVLAVLLSGIKAHRGVLGLYLGAYLASLAAALPLRRFGLDGLLASFLAGQAAATFTALGLAIRAFPGERRVRFELLAPGQSRYALGALGIAFYVGSWADKALFWANPSTSSVALGPLRFSILYDVPIFLAYLTVIPATAVLFVRLEADFADRCHDFFAAACGGAPLHRIQRLRREMTGCVRRALVEVVQVQGVTLAIVLATGPALLRLLGVSPLYLRLLYVDVVGVAFQVLFVAALNVLFYLDERGAALALTSAFAGANVALTLVSQALGPAYYGFGFASAALLAAGAGLALLARKLSRLERDTFMRQPLWPAAPRGAGGRPMAALAKALRRVLASVPRPRTAHSQQTGGQP